MEKKRWAIVRTDVVIFLKRMKFNLKTHDISPHVNTRVKFQFTKCHSFDSVQVREFCVKRSSVSCQWLVYSLLYDGVARFELAGRKHTRSAVSDIEYVFWFFLITSIQRKRSNSISLLVFLCYKTSNTGLFIKIINSFSFCLLMKNIYRLFHL